MKIGIFTDSYPPTHDGVATSVYASARELKKRGHEIYIIAPAQKHAMDFKHVYRIFSVQVFKEPPIRWGLDFPQPELVKISALDFDLIHAHSGGPISLLGLQIAKVRSIPYVLTYHTMWNRYGHYFPISKLFRSWVLNNVCRVWANSCDALIAPTDKVKNHLKRLGVYKPIYVVSSGIDIERFSEHNSKNFLHKKLNLTESTKILLSVGRFEKEKNNSFLLRAFAQITKQHPQTTLVLVGQGRDEHKLKKMSESLKISEKVYFLDSGVEYVDMPSIYKSSHIFLFSSTSESQGLAILESMACGVPVVAVEDDAFVGTLVDNQNCLLSRNNEREFEAKVCRMLENADLHHRLGKNAKHDALKFNSEGNAQALEKVYESVLAHHTMNIENLWERAIKSVMLNLKMSL